MVSVIKFTSKIIVTFASLIIIAFFGYKYALPNFASNELPDGDYQVKTTQTVETKNKANFWEDIRKNVKEKQKSNDKKKSTSTKTKSTNKKGSPSNSKVDVLKYLPQNDKSASFNKVESKRILTSSTTKTGTQKCTSDNTFSGYTSKNNSNTNYSSTNKYWYSTNTNPNHQYVSGYYKKNGTYVESYYRTKSNSTTKDNFSYYGNLNPYTKKVGKKK